MPLLEDVTDHKSCSAPSPPGACRLRVALGASSRLVRAVSARLRTVRGPRWMRPAGRSSPGRRPRRLPGRRPAAVCRSCPRRTNSARQTGLRFAGLIRVIERAVELAAALSLPGGAAGPHDELPVDPAADGVHDLVRGVAPCRSCRLGLVQVEGLHGGVAVQHGEQRPLRDSGHPVVGICARALDAAAASRPRRSRRAGSRPLLWPSRSRGRCTQRVPSGSRPTPASLSSVRATPSSATCRPAGQTGSLRPQRHGLRPAPARLPRPG